MPTYIILGKFAREGVELLLTPPETEDLAEQIAEQMPGVAIQNVWFTTGAYDVVVVLEASDHGPALGFAAAYAFAARVTTQTLAAERSDVVVPIARDAHTRHHTRHEAPDA
jgi:uncharacterized protein with GYD domain